ncbi:MAG: LPS-assembly protein LptD, partial [SAR324 cluster bacterium]|nr:LPS-assembly protein LptD [SAR324 cluster bacterium]
MRSEKCHILFLSLVLLLCAAPALGKTLSIEHTSFKYDKETNRFSYTRPRVKFGDTILSGKEMHYNKEEEMMYFSGNIVIRLPGIVLTADKATFNQKTGNSTLYNSTLYDSKNGVFVEAERIEQISDEEYIIHKGALTRCSQDSKAWELRGRLIHYQIDNYAYSLSTSIHFYTVPIFYSPYFSWPTKQGRSSGLLVPTYSTVNSSDTTKNYGGRLQVPYFIPLDRDHDVTVTADVIQRRGLGVNIDYLYAFTPEMSGRFQTWFIKETQQERDLAVEPLGSLDPENDSFDLNPLRYKYQFDHRQNIFLGGQLFFHQHENSDNEINREYFEAEVTVESHFSQTANLIFPWDGGNLSLSYQTSDFFKYSSTYDTTTDADTYLNIQPAISVSQRFSRIADTPISINLFGSATQYARTYGWSGLLKQSSIELSAPFYLDFLNIWPGVQRSYYDIETSYQNRPGEVSPEPDTYGWIIDSGSLELNFEIFRFFYNYENVAIRKLSFRPRVIYREIQDVDQSEDDTAAIIAPILSQKTLTYRLETRYLAKDPVSKAVRTFFGLDLTQIYNLQMEGEAEYNDIGEKIYLNQPSPLETKQGDPKLPLRINLSLSPVSFFSAGLFYRFDHVENRVVET